jgi:ribosomal protein S18 acetylase RimI-like enzyme
MRREELSFAMDLAAAEGWNPGLHDADCFFAADPGGFLLAELPGQGAGGAAEPVGCICAVAYGDDFGFIGLYIVRPEYRGRDYGLKLWNAGLDRLLAGAPGRNIGLDGVLAQQENYARSGFRWAFRSVRYRARSGAALAPGERPEHVAPLDGISRRVLLEYDRSCFPAEREGFLAAWTVSPGSRALAWLDDGWLAGYGVIRPCREGWKIGPLFADHGAAARGLLGALASAAGEAPVYFDVPEPHARAVALAEGLGMERVFETARMYTRGLPEVDAGRVWGVTTFELG